MSAASPKPAQQLKIERVIDAPREKVFAAWTKPEHIGQWWLPPGFTDAKIDMDLRVGGEFRFAMTPPEGERFAAVGSFREVDPPSRLVYSWNWTMPGMEEAPETLVSVRFDEKDGKTHFVLEHSGFPDAEQTAKHEEGWNRCVDAMIATL